MKEDIERVLEQIRPALARDGGNIELVDVDEANGVVRVRLQGACRGCPMSQVTLKMGVEAMLCEAIPTIKEVVSVDGGKETESPVTCHV
ncbi:NifU family protein [Candidatus Uhrbacteria bacterium]|nr:NifU family protein [Candidatus Uhrbacteria bacterium]